MGLISKSIKQKLTLIFSVVGVVNERCCTIVTVIARWTDARRVIVDGLALTIVTQHVTAACFNYIHCKQILRVFYMLDQ